MQLSPSTISNAALTAATSVGALVASQAQVVGAAVSAAGAAAVPHVSAVAPHVVTATMTGVPDAAKGLALVEKPVSVAAKSAQISPLMRFASGLSKVLPWVTIGASAAVGAQSIKTGGTESLVNTKDGRGAVLGVLGGALLLIPTPVTQIGAAAALAGAAANQFGVFKQLDGKP